MGKEELDRLPIPEADRKKLLKAIDKEREDDDADDLVKVKMSADDARSVRLSASTLVLCCIFFAVTYFSCW